MNVKLEINGNIEENSKQEIEKQVGELLRKFFTTYKFRWEENVGVQK